MLTHLSTRSQPCPPDFWKSTPGRAAREALAKVQLVPMTVKKVEERPLLVDMMKEDATRRQEQMLKEGEEKENMAVRNKEEKENMTLRNKEEKENRMLRNEEEKENSMLKKGEEKENRVVRKEEQASHSWRRSVAIAPRK